MACVNHQYYCNLLFIITLFFHGIVSTLTKLYINIYIYIYIYIYI